MSCGFQLSEAKSHSYSNVLESHRKSSESEEDVQPEPERPFPVKSSQVCLCHSSHLRKMSARQCWHRVGRVTRTHASCNWKWLSHFNPAQINVHIQRHIFFFWPCQNRFTAKQYETNQGTIGMTLPLLMKALWKGNLIHQQQLRLRAPCHYQLSTPSLMFSSADAAPAWRTALSEKINPISRPDTEDANHECSFTRR